MNQVERTRILGAVSYLNTVPLIHDLGAIEQRYELALDYPSRLADRLAKGELVAALIPTFEVLNANRYTIVSDACIGCRGPVWSVKLLCRKPIGRVRSVALDAGSRTSVALAKILLRHYWQVAPEFSNLAIESNHRTCESDAVLIIGDRAMHPEDSFCEQYDLGDVWNRWTGLPFVFAVWATDVADEMPFLDRELSLARDRGVGNLRTIANNVHQKYDLTFERCFSYLSQSLNFRLGIHEREAILRFAKLCEQMLLISEEAKVNFYDCEIAR